jgi:hypothetical protein
MTASPIQGSAHPLAVYEGRTCTGFIVPRGIACFEALTVKRQSLGLFKSRSEAADAIEEARS